MGIMCNRDEIEELRLRNNALNKEKQDQKQKIDELMSENSHLKDKNIQLQNQHNEELKRKNDYLKDKNKNNQIEKQKESNEEVNKKNDYLDCNIRSSINFEDQNKTAELNINKNVNIKNPEIIFQEKWITNYKNQNELNKALKSFMDKILIHEDYYSNRKDNSLEEPFKQLKEQGLELLKSSFNEIIRKGFKNECKQKFEELFYNNKFSF